MVDVRSLRIGSHVLVDGKRERVRGIDEDNGLIVRFPAEYVLAYECEPIPITPELLTELGFERNGITEWTKDVNGRRWVAEHYDWESWTKFNIVGTVFAAHYLHELEGYLAHCNIELIKD